MADDGEEGTERDTLWAAGDGSRVKSCATIGVSSGGDVLDGVEEEELDDDGSSCSYGIVAATTPTAFTTANTHAVLRSLCTTSNSPACSPRTTSNCRTAAPPPVRLIVDHQPLTILANTSTAALRTGTDGSNSASVSKWAPAKGRGDSEEERSDGRKREE